VRYEQTRKGGKPMAKPLNLLVARKAGAEGSGRRAAEMDVMDWNVTVGVGEI
jgi:hypothetical protein